MPSSRWKNYGLTGTNRDRPKLRGTLVACRAGDTLVVTKLDRLARSLPDARDIVDGHTAGQVKRNLGAKGMLRGKKPKLSPAGKSRVVKAWVA